MNIETHSAIFWWFMACGMLTHITEILGSNAVPVMLWNGATSVKPVANPNERLRDAFREIRNMEFRDFLAKLLSPSLPPLLVFVKEDLCSEDINSFKKILGSLKNEDIPLYWPAVESPQSVFRNLTSYNLIEENDPESLSGNYLNLVHISDLRSIEDIYSRIYDPHAVVALTGEHCRHKLSGRMKRENEASAIHPLIIAADKILFYADESPSIKINGTDYAQLYPSHHSIEVDNQSYNLSMKFESQGGVSAFNLTAQFNVFHGYYQFVCFHFTQNGESFTLNSRRDIVVPFNSSYHCSKRNIFSYQSPDKTKSISLDLINLQVQMDTKVFVGISDCIGYVSIPIWTGLFVSIILAMIIIWGLAMVIDIRTMDRFDDPKGKTIVISAQE